MSKEKVNILPTFRRALSAISMLELSNVQADLTICLASNCPQVTPSFRITVFNPSNTCAQFYFSDSETQETVDRRLLEAIDAIRTDDFDRIKKISKEVQF